MSETSTTTGMVWTRRSIGEIAARNAVWLAIMIAVMVSISRVNIVWEFLWDAPEQMADMFSRMWPVDVKYFPDTVLGALIETFHIATLGTLFTTVFGLPLAILAANNLTPSRALNLFAKFCLVASRSVNSLVWALLFVAVFGPGPLAGMVAITFRSIGFVGKLLGEVLETVPPGPIEALKAAGASRSQQLWYGYWPAIRPAFWSIMMLRWDINVRESAVLGLVGAGGLGMVLNAAIDLFQWDRVATILLTIFIIVVLVEVVITYARRKL